MRFPLSFRNVEELLAERGIHVSYETVRRWVAKFGTHYGEALGKREARPGRTWHLDEMAVRIELCHKRMRGADWVLTFPELRAPWCLLRLYYTGGATFPER